MQIVTGHTGLPHVTSDHERIRNALMVGSGRYVAPIGRQFAYELPGGNVVRIFDGVVFDQGTQGCIDTGDFDDLTLAAGTSGKKRIDWIGIHYRKDAQTAVESMTLEVIQGEPMNEAIEPDYPKGNLLEGATEDFMPLYRVTFNSLAFTLTPVFVMMNVYNNNTVLQNKVAELEEMIGNSEEIDEINGEVI